jgi:Flp pilus assembly protein TadG
MKRRQRFDQKGNCRRGTSAVEFALVAPIMMLFTFGLVEVGRITLVKQNVTHASREGARVAIRPIANTEDVIERVTNELSLLQIENATIETVPESIEDAEPGSEVTVRVRVDIADVTWIPDYFDFAVSEIVAETSMRRESTN